MGDTIDFTVMYAAHDAFRRDLDRLATAVAAGKADAPLVRAGWENFTRQLHLHHTVEDATLWPRVARAAAGSRADLDLLRAMEDEHARIDPLLAAVDAALPGGAREPVPARRAGGAPVDGLAERVEELRAVLGEHLTHEEGSALPLMRSVLTQDDWRAFTGEMRRRQGVKGAAVFVPWIVDGAAPVDRSRFLASMPPPVRALNRLTWEPRYRKQRLWNV